MKEENKTHGDAYFFVKTVWEDNGHTSWAQINTTMFKSVVFAIDAKIDFKENDIRDIYKDFRGGYWFGSNPATDGGYGKFFYQHATMSENVNACISIEKFMGIKPFILLGKRAYERMTFYQSVDERWFRITGFNLDDKSIKLMSWDNRNEEGKYKLHSLSNNEWLGFRKGIVEQSIMKRR